MSLLNAGGTVSTAWLRSLWVGLGAFAAVAIPFYLTNRADMGRGGAIEDALLWGFLALVGGAGVRGGLEGTADGLRDASGNVNSGDVGQPPAEAAKKRKAAAGG